MTIILVSVLVILILSFGLYKSIRKYNLGIYLGVMLLSILSFTQETTIINMGYLGLSFFIVVMFVTLLDQSELKKRLMGVRAELAVIGSIFALTHGLKFIVFSIDFSFFWEAPLYFYIGIASVVVMLPLFITSFMNIRKRMKGKSWKKLHRFSYLFYAFVALHLLWIQNGRFVFYSVIFCGYGLMKCWDLFKMHRKNSLRLHQQKPVNPSSVL